VTVDPADALELFSERDGDEGSKEGVGPGRPSVSEAGERPLAARMRPRTLSEFEGQRHLLGPGRVLKAMIDRCEVGSMIFWGPPGSGKTTLAKLLAEGTDARFEAFSAVTEGVARVREIIGQAKERLKRTGRQTILFCDEIHRFNKAQQDAFLPHVEDGTIILMGATTENPSFEVVRPLLSRAPVFLLEPLSEEELVSIVRLALEDEERGLGKEKLRWEESVLAFLARESDGDARRALGILEGAANLAGTGGELTPDLVKEAAQLRFAVYDKSGEEHFNLISALHKAVRGSDPDAALYWLGRMLAGGEDPLYVARRLIRMATEDIGLSDPSALQIAVAARDAFHFLGSPEGELALAEATVYMATAPKSNRIYAGWSEAREAARTTPGAAVPLHIRNAPTKLMKELGYGGGYRYDHDELHGVAPQSYLPEELGERSFYRPGPFGHEATIRKRLEWWAEKRAEAEKRSSDGVGPLLETEEGGGEAQDGTGGSAEGSARGSTDGSADGSAGGSGG
jgi:putative ATPase